MIIGYKTWSYNRDQRIPFLSSNKTKHAVQSYDEITRGGPKAEASAEGRSFFSFCFCFGGRSFWAEGLAEGLNFENDVSKSFQQISKNFCKANFFSQIIHF